MPPGLVAVSKTLYIETATFHELHDYEWARICAEQYRAERGEWPTVRKLMTLCVIRRWAAHRGLKAAKEAAAKKCPVPDTF